MAHAAILLLAAVVADVDPDLREWLENAVARHRFTLEEAAAATGITTERAAAAVKELGLDAAKAAGPTRSSDGNLLVLPYPGGRHPRIGFLDGAVNPWRETKASIFLPWEGAGYVVVDLPEALWSNLGLTFLAHTHIPTVWDKQKVAIGHRDWSRAAGGVLENRFWLPNKLEIVARVVPRKEVVDLELRLRNGSAEKLTGLRTQVCLLLRGAPDFAAQTNDNKVIAGRAMAVRSSDGKRWIATAWERAKPWGNPPCPCMHSDPTFPDLAPGESSVLRGRVFFFEGEDIQAEIARREKDGSLDAAPLEASAVELVSARRIWDAAPHCAFTGLARFHGAWWCAFREGAGHVSPDGAIRILTSPDGDAWASAALLRAADGDLRDPKLAVAPDGRLHLCSASALHAGPVKHQSLEWLSKDGRDWGEPVKAGDPNVWLWRVQWNEATKTAYGIGYATDGKNFIRLYRSDDGLRFDRVADRIFDHGEPNESSLEFFEDGTAVCLLRRDDAEGDGQVGTASPPCEKWSWKGLGARIGGPHILRVPDGRFIAAVRLYDGKVRTSLCWVEPRTGRFQEVLALPSGGDTSYAGLGFHDGLLHVSYYSSHEGKTCIYFAKVRLPRERW